MCSNLFPAKEPSVTLGKEIHLLFRFPALCHILLPSSRGPICRLLFTHVAQKRNQNKILSQFPLPIGCHAEMNGAPTQNIFSTLF